jgi:carbon monoxide dehydrogenase subunit G
VIDRPVEEVFAHVTDPSMLAEWQPNVVSVSKETVPIHGDNEFQPADGGTRIRFVAHGELGGALRLAEPILARALRRQFARDYARLKEALEAGGG